MKGLLCHALIVTAVLIGGDLRFNDGRDSEALFTVLRADVAVRGAQVQAYHVNESLDRQLALLLLPAAH